jgi:hypothetical protein
MVNSGLRGRHMSEYRFVFGALRSETIVQEIDLQGTYMDLALNTGGRFDGTFQLDQTGKDNQTLMDATEPGRTFVAVERNGLPIWVGFVWSRTYQSQSKTCQLFAQSFEKYPEYQLVQSAFVDTDEQLVLFRDLWTSMQSVPGRDVNVIVPSGTLPTLQIKAVDVVPGDFKFYGEVMSSLADASDGFDWYVGVNKVGNQYTKTLRFGYPTLGTLDPSALVFDYPGAILNYYATESMSIAGTNVFTVGSGEGSSMIFHESTQTTMIAQGFPRWDYVVSRKDIGSQSLIDGIGTQEGVRRKPPMLTLKLSFKGEESPEFGSFGLGDACTTQIQDARFPNRKFTGRIVKWELNPQSSENVEEYNILFEGDEEG